MTTGATGTPNERMKVFISYARADVGFAEQLRAFLEDERFTPILDRYDSDLSDASRKRRSALILGADAFIVVLTDAAAEAESCAWEIEEALHLGKRVFSVLPEPLNIAPPAGLGARNFIYFYSEPTIPDSGFYDGQKQLAAALRLDLEWLRGHTFVLEHAMRWDARGGADYLMLRGSALEDAISWRDHAPPDAVVHPVVDEFLEASVRQEAAARSYVDASKAELKTLHKELRKAREEVGRITSAAAAGAATRPTPPRAPLPPPRPPERPPRPASHSYGPPPKRRSRLPVKRLAFLALVIVLIVAAATNADTRQRLRAMWAEGMTLWAAVNEEPSTEPRVSAEDYVPERPAFASRSGANVRDYPLPNADILVELAAATPLNINGRLNVQGDWWFRVVLEDQRVGFVREDAIAFGRAPQAPAQISVDALDPPLPARAGRAGAKIRTSPARNASVIVRVERGAELTATGRVRRGEHWWYRVVLTDGRQGFAREDVLLSPTGGRLAP